MITMPKKKPVSPHIEKRLDDFISRGMAAPDAREKPKAAKTRTQMPVSITMAPAFLAQLDKAAASLSMNRSAFVKLAVADFIKRMG